MITTASSTECPEARAQVLMLGGPDPDESGIASLLLHYNITTTYIAGLEPPEGMPKARPDLVVMTIDSLTAECLDRVRTARRYCAPVLCTIPREESDNIFMIEQLAAEDYIIRPFYPDELTCRIQLLMLRHGSCSGEKIVERRSFSRRREDQSRQHPAATERDPSYSIDDRRKLIMIGRREIHLTPKEYILFCLLASERGRVFSSEEIIEQIWSSSKRASLLDVQQYVHLLRRKIEIDPAHPRWLVTVPGFGYSLELSAET